MTIDMPRIQLWSSGGGVQSTALAVMIIKGILPKPDLAVIVDTERELRTTFEYANAYTIPALADVGVTLHRVSKSTFATVDLYRNDDILIPAFTNHTGEISKLPTYCSNEWKQRVVRRWANEQYSDAEFDLWMGISFDEPRRIKQEVGKWQYVYPLFERRITRNECVRLVLQHGWPPPPRSSCWMCPNHTASEWRRIKKEHHDDFEMAIAFEQVIRETDDSLWLHPAGLPLDEAVDTPPTLFDTERCDSGYCFV